VAVTSVTVVVTGDGAVGGRDDTCGGVGGRIVSFATMTVAFGAGGRFDDDVFGEMFFGFSPPAATLLAGLGALEVLGFEFGAVLEGFEDEGGLEFPALFGGVCGFFAPAVGGAFAD